MDTLTTPQSCMLPARLPVLIGLDHKSNADTQAQRVDYVYVRPSTASEPLVTIEGDAVRCPGT